MLEYLNKR